MMRWMICILFEFRSVEEQLLLSINKKNIGITTRRKPKKMIACLIQGFKNLGPTERL